ncbi:hypothetical protein BpHYR1_052483, partial [Brachionus plicatilis]
NGLGVGMENKGINIKSFDGNGDPKEFKENFSLTVVMVGLDSVKSGQNEKTMENNKGFYNVNDYSREESPDLNEVELELVSIESTIDIKSISCIPKLINKKCRLVFNNDQETQKKVALFDGGETN